MEKTAVVEKPLTTTLVTWTSSLSFPGCSEPSGGGFVAAVGTP
jgi:hypothetical protein